MPAIRPLRITLGLLAAAGLSSWFAEAAAADLPSARRALGVIQPRISPDGESIALSYLGAIWTIPRAGGVLRRLTSGPGFDAEPAWSPDGKRIAYLATHDFQEGHLQVIAAAGGAPLASAAASSGRLYFHPDGRRVLGLFQGLAWLFLETGKVTPLFDPPRGTPVFCLSPDGQAIAYATAFDRAGEQSGSDGPQNDLWRVAASGGEPERLLQFPSRIHDLWWSRRGIILASDLGGAHNDLWQIPLEGPRLFRKLTHGQADEARPSVCADDRWLVHTDNAEGATSLAVVDLESGERSTVAATGLDFGCPDGEIEIELVEKGSGRPLTARVSLESAGGKCAAPPGAIHRVLYAGSRFHFHCAERTRFRLPAGSYDLRSSRGPEYRPFKAAIAVPPGGLARARVELERWIDPASAGWRSGESHIHANYGYGVWYRTPESLRFECEGEGLEVANLMVANSDGDGVFDREFFLGKPDPHSSTATILYFNEEFRSTSWGHMTLLDLNHLVEPIFTGFAGTTQPWDAPTNAEVARLTRLQGGHANYTHPASNPGDPFLGAYSAKALPVDVALGVVDSIDINGSYTAAVPLWHRLLNCGFRLPASAGTDCFLNRMVGQVPGADRVYVKVEGPLAYRSWIEGLRSGRTFVTNGPILELSAADKGIGATVRLERPAKVAVRGLARWQFPLERAELVVNGATAAAASLSADRLEARFEGEVAVERSGWLGFRAFGGGDPAEPSRNSFQAHTSPIYLEVTGRPAASLADAEFFLAWIDRLEELIRIRDRVPGPELRARVAEQLEAARQVFRKVKEQAASS
jgi:TolB protein